MFPKELTHGLGPKMAIFANFFSSNIGQENVFYDILGRKKAFQGAKNNNLNNSKKLAFFRVRVRVRPGTCHLG